MILVTIGLDWRQNWAIRKEVRRRKVGKRITKTTFLIWDCADNENNLWGSIQWLQVQMGRGPIWVTRQNSERCSQFPYYREWWDVHCNTSQIAFKNIHSIFTLQFIRCTLLLSNHLHIRSKIDHFVLLLSEIWGSMIWWQSWNNSSLHSMRLDHYFTIPFAVPSALQKWLMNNEKRT